MFNETSYNCGMGGLSVIGGTLGATPALSPSQQQIASRIAEVGQQRGASQKQIQAALATGWVESRYRNLSYGDRDSLGVFQQRPSQGWGSPSEVQNLDYAINAFYDAASKVNDSNMTFGQLAQAVQRSAFPARYDQAGSIVDSILSLFRGASSSSGGGDVTTSSPDVETTILATPFLSGVPGWAMAAAGLLALYFVLK